MVLAVSKYITSQEFIQIAPLAFREPLSFATKATVQELYNYNKNSYMPDPDCISRKLVHLYNIGTVVMPLKGGPYKQGESKCARKAHFFDGTWKSVALVSDRYFKNSEVHEEKKRLIRIRANHLLNNRAYFKISNQQFYIELYFEGGSLYDFINSYSQQSGYEKQSLQYVLSVAMDLKERFHDRGLVHHDIDSKNIMLDECNGNGVATLIDYEYVNLANETEEGCALDILQLAAVLNELLCFDAENQKKLQNYPEILSLYSMMSDTQWERRPTIEYVIKCLTNIISLRNAS